LVIDLVGLAVARCMRLSSRPDRCPAGQRPGPPRLAHRLAAHPRAWSAVAVPDGHHMGHVLVFPARPAAAWPAGRSVGGEPPERHPAAIAWAIIARAGRGLTANCASGGIPAARHRSGSPVQDWARTALAYGSLTGCYGFPQETARPLLHGWRRDDGQINPHLGLKIILARGRMVI
jgi:hypothetical protein